MQFLESLRQERFQIGTKPETFNQAVIRLPLPGKFTEKDEELQHIALFRIAIEKTLASLDSRKELSPLESRMTPLTLEELKLVESNCFSFKRYPVPYIVSWWSRLKPENKWAHIYGSSDEDYLNWKVHTMSPNFDFTTGISLICIQTINQFEKEATKENSQFLVGPATTSEILELKYGLMLTHVTFQRK